MEIALEIPTSNSLLHQGICHNPESQAGDTPVSNLTRLTNPNGSPICLAFPEPLGER
jgi:hypothetical protein